MKKSTKPAKKPAPSAGEPTQSEQVKNPVGRPSLYSKEIADIICRELIAGTSLPTICKPDTMPSKTTVYNWLAEATSVESSPDLKDFLDRYTRARQLQPDALIDECLSIADDGTNDWYMKKLKDGGEVPAFDKENVQRSKLRVDTRIILAERLAPHKYRPSSAIDHTVSAPSRIVWSEPPPEAGE